MKNKCIYPNVLTTEITDDSTVLTLLVPEELLYFDGHFDQASLLPGVVQIDWAVYFGQKIFDYTGEFSGLEVIKFKDVISPNQQVELTLQFKENKNKLLFSYQSDSGTCSSGRIVFDKEEGVARGEV
mgnify:CR=1 FL=1